MDDRDFTIPYITDTIPNSPAGHQLPSQARNNVWIIAINGEEPITYQGVLDELNSYKSTQGRSKINISLCRREIYQITDLEEIRSRFDQVRPVVSHIEVCLPKKLPTPKNIGEDLSVPQRQFWKEALFVKYDKNTNVNLLSDPIPIKSLPEGKKVLRSIIATIVKEGGCYDAWKYVARNCAKEVLRLKVLILINHTVQWNMLDCSESTLLLHICID